MKDILEYMAAAKHRVRYACTSPDAFFALRLAVRLNDVTAAAHYAELMEQHGPGKLLSAYYLTMATLQPGESLGRKYQSVLLSNGSHNGVAKSRKLLAVKVSRRFIAVALFSGTHFQGQTGRHSRPSTSDPAFLAAYFIRKVVADHDCSSVALEADPGRPKTIRAKLHGAIKAQLAGSGISVWEVSSTSVIAAFGQPPLRNRNELRAVISAIWPLPGLRHTDTYLLDALALGLYVQTERLFNHLDTYP